MAYYSSNYHESYLAQSYLAPYYGGHYDIVPSQLLMADSTYEFSNQDYFAYRPTPCHDAAYDPAMNHSVLSYSVSTFTEPKSILYDLYSGDYDHAPTQFRIAYSVSQSEFNEPEFEEYDPTPYGGGYDPDSTYGKPLPPSDEVCYPRSMPDSTALPLNGVTLGSLESPYGKEDADESAAKPHIESKQSPTPEDKQQFDAGNGDDRNKEYVDSSEKPLGLYQGDYGHEDYCKDNSPWSNHGSGYNEGNSCEYEKTVPQIPCGYGLEGMDLCESIFGFWPCLAHNNRRSHDCQQFANGESSGSNQWKETADYIFGSSNPYEQSRDGGGSYGHVIHSYQKHHQQQPLYRQIYIQEIAKQFHNNVPDFLVLSECDTTIPIPLVNDATTNKPHHGELVEPCQKELSDLETFTAEGKQKTDPVVHARHKSRRAKMPPTWLKDFER